MKRTMRIRQATCEIEAVNRKWIKATENGKPVLVKINKESADWQPGQTYTFWAIIRTESGQVWQRNDERVKSWFHCLLTPFDPAEEPPLTEAERRAEIDRWLYYIQQAANEGRYYKKGVEKVIWLGIEKSATRSRKLKMILKEMLIARAGNEATAILDHMAQEPPDFKDLERQFLRLIEILTEVGKAIEWAGNSLVKRLNKRYSEIKGSYGRQMTIFDILKGAA